MLEVPAQVTSVNDHLIGFHLYTQTPQGCSSGNQNQIKLGVVAQALLASKADHTLTQYDSILPFQGKNAGIPLVQNPQILPVSETTSIRVTKGIDDVPLGVKGYELLTFVKEARRRWWNWYCTVIILYNKALFLCIIHDATIHMAFREKLQFTSQ